MRTVAVLLVCLSRTVNGFRLHLVEGQLQSSLQERHEFSKNVNETLSRYVSLSESKQSESDANAGMQNQLRSLVKGLLVFKPAAGWQVTGHLDRHMVNKPSGAPLTVPRSLGVGFARVVSPWQTPQRTIQRRAIVRQAVPRMAEGDDDNFESALSHLSLSNVQELHKVRMRVRELESQVSAAIQSEDYEAAARLRDEVGMLRSKDPAVLSSSLRTKMQAAIRGERYDEASRCRDQLAALKRFQPQYQLAGQWLAKDPQRGDVLVRIAYDGDELIANYMDGALWFSADVAVPQQSDDNSDWSKQVVAGTGKTPQEVDFFAGVGEVWGPELVPGRMYVMDDNVICFLYLRGPGEQGGGGGDLATGGMAGARGERDQEETRDAGGGQEETRDAGGGNDEVVRPCIVFEKLDGDNEDNIPQEPHPSAAVLEKLFKLDIGANNSVEPE